MRALERELFEGTHNMGHVNHQRFVLEVHRCGTCGIVWAIDDEFMEARRSDHEDWVCPNGHSFVFNGPSKEEKLRAELDRERARSGRLAAERDQTKARLNATKGVVTKQRKKLARVANGVCPCCERSFPNLQRHMQTKHPEYKLLTEEATPMQKEAAA